MDNIREGVALFSTTWNLDGVTGEGVFAALSANTVLDGPIFDGSAVTEGASGTSIT